MKRIAMYALEFIIIFIIVGIMFTGHVMNSEPTKFIYYNF